MGMRSLFLTLFFMSAAMVSGCASLEAARPLFTAADQIGPPPIQEGVWLGVGAAECPDANARRQRNFDRGCVPLELRRLEDGAWQVRVRADLAPRMPAEDRANADRTGAIRFVLVPAVERTSADAFSPLYVAELRSAKPGEESVSYYTIVPIGELPATSLLLMDMSCASILRDGPIDGVDVTYERIEPTTAPATPSTAPKMIQLRMKQDQPEDDANASPAYASCVASTQAAVREAARRTLIQTVGRDYGQRLVLIRPLDH